MKKRYAFRWIGGGWNEVLASTMLEATVKAAQFGAGDGSRKRLRPDVDSFVIVEGGKQNPYYQFID